LAKAKLTQEVLELLRVEVSEVITLGEHLVDVHVVLPHQVLHAVSKAHFGRQSFGALEVIHLLPVSGLEFKSILTLGCVQKVKGMNSVVIRVVKVLDRVLNPLMLVGERVSHVLVLSKHRIDLLVWIQLRVLPTESLNGVLSSFGHLLWAQILTHVLLIINQFEHFLNIILSGHINLGPLVALAGLEALLHKGDKGELPVLEISD
jgi:hypothetical protein